MLQKFKLFYLCFAFLGILLCAVVISHSDTNGKPTLLLQVSKQRQYNGTLIAGAVKHVLIEMSNCIFIQFYNMTSD